MRLGPQLEAEAEALVRRYWRVVTGVAKALLGRREPTEGEVARIFPEARAHMGGRRPAQEQVRPGDPASSKK